MNDRAFSTGGFEIYRLRGRRHQAAGVQQPTDVVGISGDERTRICHTDWRYGDCDRGNDRGTIVRTAGISAREHHRDRDVLDHIELYSHNPWGMAARIWVSFSVSDARTIFGKGHIALGSCDLVGGRGVARGTERGGIC